MFYVADQIVPLDLLLPKQGEDQYKCCFHLISEHAANLF